MLPGVQRMWGNEPSHPQVNSHCASWSPKWTPKFSERDFKGQNPSAWKFIYIIGKLLKRRCLKWARITHLDIWNTSYDQKKGRESNWQFDSRPIWLPTIKSQDSTQFRHVQAAWDIQLKSFRHRLQLCFRPHYNRRSAHKVMRPQSRGNPNYGNFRTPTWESPDKKSFGCGPYGELQSTL
jgi:hypothetical protein